MWNSIEKSIYLHTQYLLLFLTFRPSFLSENIFWAFLLSWMSLIPDLDPILSHHIVKLCWSYSRLRSTHYRPKTRRSFGLFQNLSLGCDMSISDCQKQYFIEYLSISVLNWQRNSPRGHQQLTKDPTTVVKSPQGILLGESTNPFLRDKESSSHLHHCHSTHLFVCLSSYLF